MKFKIKRLKEGAVSRLADTVYAFRFVRLLVQKWENTGAFKAGILDKDGNNIIKSKDVPAKDKQFYTYFHRLVFNVKRLLGKVPGGKSTLGSIAAALYLIKEHTKMSDDALEKALVDYNIDWDNLTESTWFQTQEGDLNPGVYMLTTDISSPLTGDIIAFKNSKVKVKDVTMPSGYICSIPMYEVHHVLTNQKIYIHNGDIIR
jgi:hypothetical protein